MAVMQIIRNLFSSPPEPVTEIPVHSSPESVYQIRPLTDKQLIEVWKLNQRCFEKHESYPKSTLNFLLTQPNTLSYRAVDSLENMAGFVFVSVQEGVAHLTTIGVAPEHRRRKLASLMVEHCESALRMRGISMFSLEVRVSNVNAQTLYRGLDFAVMQRLRNYYSDGEDGFLMVKSLL